MKKRVVITGLGAVTPIGIGIEEFWESCMKGESGVAKIQSFDTERSSIKIAAQVEDDDLLTHIPDPKDRSLDRFSQFALVATKEAAAMAQLDLDVENEFGVYIGSSLGGMIMGEKSIHALNTRGPRRVHPLLIQTIMISAASAEVAIRCNLTGPNLGTSGGFSAGASSIAQAYNMMQLYDNMDVVFAGGSDAPILPLVSESFFDLGVVSQQNNEPEKASRPFDMDRDGLVLGEGAGIVALESIEHAHKRGAPILAEIAAIEATYDIHNMLSPISDGDGRVESMVRTMNLALKEASLSPSDIDYVNAHGVSIQESDAEETEAIKAVFGDHAYRLSVSSTKSMIGHTIGAAGPIGLIACVLAIKNGIAPPTINYENPDPRCDLDYVPNAPKEKKISATISNSFGLDGDNVTIATRKYED